MGLGLRRFGFSSAWNITQLVTPGGTKHMSSMDGKWESEIKMKIKKCLRWSTCRDNDSAAKTAANTNTTKFTQLETRIYEHHYQY